MSYCTPDLPDHEQIACEEYLNGGIDALSLNQPDAVVNDYAVAEDWQTEIDASRIKIITGIRAEFPDPTPTEVDNPVGGGASTIITGMECQLNVLDYHSTAQNDQFWAEANGKKFKIAWREPENGIIKVVERLCTVIATPVMVPGDNKQLQRYNVVIKWTGKRNFFPVRYDEPANIFDADA